MATSSSVEVDGLVAEPTEFYPLRRALRFCSLASRELRLPDTTRTGLKYYEYPYTVKDYPFTVEGVYGFLHDNSFNAADINDIIFGVIEVKLVDSKLIIPNNKSAFDLSEKEAQNIPEVLSEDELKTFASSAKTMILVALHAHCQGKFDKIESVSFYRSFCSVKGPKKTPNLSQCHFDTIVKMLLSSAQVEEITKLITVDDIRSKKKNVFWNKLFWFSTPKLIKAALKALPSETIVSRFDPVSLNNYTNFSKAGILAHVASGPLAPYCKGEVDVMKCGEEDIPHDLPLCALKAIDQPPYDTKTIKRAYIILKETKYKFGKWYQGKKAMKVLDLDDFDFTATVREVIKATQDSATTSVSQTFS